MLGPAVQTRIKQAYESAGLLVEGRDIASLVAVTERANVTPPSLTGIDLLLAFRYCQFPLFWSSPIGFKLIVSLLTEESHATQPRRPPFVPSQAAAKQIVLKRLWEAIPESNRQQAWQALSQLLAQQLQPPPEKEVRDEDC
jgi:hypothetical protein